MMDLQVALMVAQTAALTADMMVGKTAAMQFVT